MNVSSLFVIVMCVYFGFVFVPTWSKVLSNAHSIKTLKTKLGNTLHLRSILVFWDWISCVKPICLKFMEDKLNFLPRPFVFVWLCFKWMSVLDLSVGSECADVSAVFVRM